MVLTFGSPPAAAPALASGSRSGIPKWIARAVSIAASLGAVVAQQGLSPETNFCRRFGHQTTVIDDKLYIDGGYINWNPLTQYPNNYSSISLPSGPSTAEASNLAFPFTVLCTVPYTGRTH